MEREERIEPSLLAWKARVLPLNYSRMRRKMGSEGFEPPKRVQQIYSLPPLTTWVTARQTFVKKAG